jgi:hypothetical protein
MEGSSRRADTDTDTDTSKAKGKTPGKASTSETGSFPGARRATNTTTTT